MIVTNLCVMLKLLLPHNKLAADQDECIYLLVVVTAFDAKNFVQLLIIPFKLLKLIVLLVGIR